MSTKKCCHARSRKMQQHHKQISCKGKNIYIKKIACKAAYDEIRENKTSMLQTNFL